MENTNKKTTEEEVVEAETPQVDFKEYSALKEKLTKLEDENKSLRAQITRHEQERDNLLKVQERRINELNKVIQLHKNYEAIIENASDMANALYNNLLSEITK